MKTLAWILCLHLFLAGCQLPVTPTATAEKAELGQPFALRFGHTARLYGTPLDVTFASLLTDGRCPTNIQCAETAPVAVEVRIGRAGSVIGELLELSAHTDATGAVVPTAPGAVISATYGSYSVHLLAVTPYPDAQRKSAVAEYGVTLLVVQEKSDEQTPPGLSESTFSAALGEEIELGVGETALLPDEQLWLRFDEVTKDSRCPSNVSCVWSGIVDTQMSTRLADRQAKTFVVGGATDGEGIVTGPIVEASGPTEWWYEGYVIALKQVLPYPARHDQPIAPADYRAVVVVRAAEKQPPPEATAEPSPTPSPTPTDSSALPLLCISEVALTRLAAGASTDQPAALTPPVSEQTLVDEATGDSLCASQFGEDWHMAETSDLGAVWEDFLPDAAGYWVWDYPSEKPRQVR